MILCSNCVHAEPVNGNYWCNRVSTICAEGFGCINGESKPTTHADRIRAMTDEELAEFFPSTASEFSCPPGATMKNCEKAGGWFHGCPKCWLTWLQEVTDD